jgi:hypothetical protein
MEISPGAHDAEAADHRLGGVVRRAGPEYCGPGRAICPVEGIIWGKVRRMGFDGDSKTLWRAEARSDKIRQRQRQTVRIMVPWPAVG